jgi:nicotinamidase-related amidase
MEKMVSFYQYLAQLVEQAPKETVSRLISQVGNVSRLYLVFVDILKGFCETGPLSSQRVNEMVKPCAELAKCFQDHGVPEENFVFLHDAHSQDAAEFAVFPPHCIRQTDEAEIVEPLRPFYELSKANRFFKNATNGLFAVNEDGKVFHQWLEEIFAGGQAAFVIVGDCTDLCIYQNAMGIRLLANERNAQVRIIVPRSHIRTYDLSIEDARRIGALAHDADFLECVFLYHMKLNGVEIFSHLQPE